MLFCLVWWQRSKCCQLFTFISSQKNIGNPIALSKLSHTNFCFANLKDDAQTDVTCLDTTFHLHAFLCAVLDRDSSEEFRARSRISFLPLLSIGVDNMKRKEVIDGQILDENVLLYAVRPSNHNNQQQPQTNSPPPTSFCCHNLLLHRR